MSSHCRVSLFVMIWELSAPSWKVKCEFSDLLLLHMYIQFRFIPSKRGGVICKPSLDCESYEFFVNSNIIRSIFQFVFSFMKVLIPSGHKSEKISQRAIISYANNFFLFIQQQPNPRGLFNVN